jgi:hypothetical protein
MVIENVQHDLMQNGFRVRFFPFALQKPLLVEKNERF